TERNAFVHPVLIRNSFRNWLQALEACRRLKMRALFTAMQRRATFRAVALHVGARLQRRGTAIATGRGYRLHQPGQAWTGYVKRRTRTLGARLLIPVLLPATLR